MAEPIAATCINLIDSEFERLECLPLNHLGCQNTRKGVQISSLNTKYAEKFKNNLEKLSSSIGIVILTNYHFYVIHLYFQNFVLIGILL